MTTFALHPELQFEYALAQDLHMTVARMHEEMDCVELIRWEAFYKKRALQQKAAARSKRGR